MTKSGQPVTSVVIAMIMQKVGNGCFWYIINNKKYKKGDLVN